jgi:hypothetical protein
MTDLWTELSAILSAHPGAAGIFLIYLAGVGTGWRMARRSTAYMLGGRL